MKRAVDLIRNVTLDATTGATVAITPPNWAKDAILHVALTDVGASTTPSLDALVYQRLPVNAGTNIAVPSVSIDALSAAGNAFVAFGLNVEALSGTKYDGAPCALSRYMEVVFTQDRTDTDEEYSYKAWVEYLG